MPSITELLEVMPLSVKSIKTKAQLFRRNLSVPSCRALRGNCDSFCLLGSRLITLLLMAKHFNLDALQGSVSISFGTL